MVDTGSVSVTGMVDVVIVLVEDPNDPEVEEKKKGEWDEEDGPEVNPDAQEVVHVEELPRCILLDRQEIHQRHWEEIVESLLWNLSNHCRF